jgi:hypothetical protein
LVIGGAEENGYYSTQSAGIIGRQRGFLFELSSLRSQLECWNVEFMGFRRAGELGKWGDGEAGI